MLKIKFNFTFNRKKCRMAGIFILCWMHMENFRKITILTNFHEILYLKIQHNQEEFLCGSKPDDTLPI
jgi:hypothetical protein